MRLLIILALVLLLTACFPKAEQGKGMYGALSSDQRQQTNAITGQVIGDIYNQQSCADDSNCGPGQACVNQTCVLKH